jgi:hypothetical protein
MNEEEREKKKYQYTEIKIVTTCIEDLAVGQN